MNLRLSATKVSPPSWILTPGCKAVLVVRVPATHRPFLLSRSWISHPVASGISIACSRDSRAALSWSRTSQLGADPSLRGTRGSGNGWAYSVPQSRSRVTASSMYQLVRSCGSKLVCSSVITIAKILVPSCERWLRSRRHMAHP